MEAYKGEGQFVIAVELLQAMNCPFPLTYFLNFYWHVVDLQCCVSFRCTAKCIKYTYLKSFLDYFPIQVTTEY